MHPRRFHVVCSTTVCAVFVLVLYTKLFYRPFAGTIEASDETITIDSETITIDSNQIIDFETMFLRSKTRGHDLDARSSQLTLWSTDYHISPIHSLKKLLEHMKTDKFRFLNVTVIDKSLSSHCHLTRTCASDLHVLTRANGITLSQCKNEFKHEFYDYYRRDKEFSSVDVIACHHSVAMCELYMPFLHGRSVLVRTSTRFEWGRYPSKAGCEMLVNNLRLLALSPGAVFTANNAFDQMYMYYYTGIKPLLFPDLTMLSERYDPKKKSVIIVQDHGKGLSLLLKGLQDSKTRAENQIEFIPFRDLYKQYKYSDLVQHIAAIAIPYQVSIMKLMELYWMGIPLLLPSAEFYAELHVNYSVANELTWKHVQTGRPAMGSDVIFKHPTVSEEIPDPMAENNITAMRYWMQFTDWSYQWKNILYFDSWDDIIIKMLNTNFTDVSNKMMEENQIRLKQNAHILQWIMTRVESIKTTDRTMPSSEEISMRQLFGEQYFSKKYMGQC